MQGNGQTENPKAGGPAPPGPNMHGGAPHGMDPNNPALHDMFMQNYMNSPYMNRMQQQQQHPAGGAPPRMPGHDHARQQQQQQQQHPHAGAPYFPQGMPAPMDPNIMAAVSQMTKEQQKQFQDMVHSFTNQQHVEHARRAHDRVDNHKLWEMMSGHTSMLETIVNELRQESELRKTMEAQNIALTSEIKALKERIGLLESATKEQGDQNKTVMKALSDAATMYKKGKEAQQTSASANSSQWQNSFWNQFQDAYGNVDQYALSTQFNEMQQQFQRYLAGQAASGSHAPHGKGKGKGDGKGKGKGRKNTPIGLRPPANNNNSNNNSKRGDSEEFAWNKDVPEFVPGQWTGGNNANPAASSAAPPANPENNASNAEQPIRQDSEEQVTIQCDSTEGAQAEEQAPVEVEAIVEEEEQDDDAASDEQAQE